jgi:hypothetical protein
MQKHDKVTIPMLGYVDAVSRFMQRARIGAGRGRAGAGLFHRGGAKCSQGYESTSKAAQCYIRHPIPP